MILNSNVVEQMDLSTETKGIIIDLLRQHISIEKLAKGADNIAQKSELYLASCLVINRIIHQNKRISMS